MTGFSIDFVAVAAIVASLAALVGIPIAVFQTIEARRATQLQAFQTLWGNFDDEAMRAYRRRIHLQIPSDVSKRPSISELGDDLWNAIEVTATAMDRVGSLMAHGLVPEDIIFERYSEVIIPLWEKLQPYIDARRGEKGSGWRFFGPLPRSSSPAASARDLYSRACLYRTRHHPNETYSTFAP